jgi:hypothetical protein
LASEVNSGLSMSFDDTHPQSKGRTPSFENVCLACRSCNENKSDLTEEDSLTSEILPLYQPANAATVRAFYLEPGYDTSGRANSDHGSFDR